MVLISTTLFIMVAKSSLAKMLVKSLYIKKDQKTLDLDKDIIHSMDIRNLRGFLEVGRSM